ncbi:MAG: TonB family protein [bacterium]
MAFQSKRVTGAQQPDTAQKEKKLVLQIHLLREPGDGEKVLLNKSSVTAGSQPANDLVIPCPLKRFTFLKKRRSGGYELFIPGEMTGIIGHPDQTDTVSIDSLRNLNLLPRKNQGHTLFLPVGNRAELSYGGVRLDLGYVPEPPPPPRSREEQASEDVLEHGFLEGDQKGFWTMFLLSLCLHVLFILYVYMAPLPPPSQEQTTAAEIPERLVRLILKEEEKQKDIQASRLLKEEKKAAPLTQPPVQKTSPPVKEAKPAQQPAQKAQIKPRQAESSSGKDKPRQKTAQSVSSSGASGEPKPSLVASTDGTTAAKDGGSDVLRQGEGQTSVSSPEKKVDLNSIGILGMISSRQSSRSPSSPGIDSQLNLLAKNAINSGKTLVRQIEKSSPPLQAFTGEGLNDELPLGDGEGGEEPGNAHDAGKGTEGKKAKEAEKSRSKTSSSASSAKKVDDLVAMHQQTDTVELPVKGDLALQKIVDVKTSGPKSQFRTPQAILEVVSSYKSSIIHCYNKALKVYPRLEGRLVVEFTITAQGEVVDVKVVSSTLPRFDSGLDACVTNMIQSWRFASIPVGITTVVYPFVFFPAM